LPAELWRIVDLNLGELCQQIVIFAPAVQSHSSAPDVGLTINSHLCAVGLTVTDRLGTEMIIIEVSLNFDFVLK
jgi:hypothetical protein